MCIKKFILAAALAGCGNVMPVYAQGRAQMIETADRFYPGMLWMDTEGRVINAHGGGMLYHEGVYYWFGEHKASHTNSALEGVTCYSSTDLYNWKNHGVVFSVSSEAGSPIEKGCIIERPKVIYNAKTGKFVMYFHLELKGKGYGAANVGVAVADKVDGPYTLVRNGRVNPGKWAKNTPKYKATEGVNPDSLKWWTAEWRVEVEKGYLADRDKKGGQMSRDMTLFVDDNGKAYHIYSSEENLTLNIAELSSDYLRHTGRYVRVAPGGQNEAPAIFKHEGKYYMITSGCTGWRPNEARMFSADNIEGPWTQHPNPCIGKGAATTFESQSTFIFPVAGKDGKYVFMADRWRPENPIDGRYVWLPIEFENGLPVLRWHKEWKID